MASQQEFYEAEWSKITLAKEHASRGWATLVPAPDFQKFARWLAEHRIKGRALDLGCGAGRYTIALAEQGLEAYGIDFAKSAIRQAQSNAQTKGLQTRVHFRVGNILELPYDDNFFDVVNDDGCLHHIDPDHWQDYLANVTRVLKDEGTLRIKVFSQNSQLFLGHGGAQATPWIRLKSSGYTYFFDEATIHKIFEPKFRIVDLEENVHPKDPNKNFLFIILTLLPTAISSSLNT